MQRIDIVVGGKDFVDALDAVAGVVELYDFKRGRGIAAGLQVVDEGLEVGHRVIDDHDLLALLLGDRGLLLGIGLLRRRLLFLGYRGLLGFEFGLGLLFRLLLFFGRGLFFRGCGRGFERTLPVVLQLFGESELDRVVAELRAG